MSDCDEPCDACGNRGTHHLCDTCCEEEAKALEAKLHEVQAVLTEDVRLDQWEKCGIIDSAFIANLRQARRERDEARAEVERLKELLTEQGILLSRLGIEKPKLDALVQASWRTVAERQREACAAAVEAIQLPRRSWGDGEQSIGRYDGIEDAAERVRDTPLVTEGDK